MAPEELTDQPYVSIVVLTLNSETTIKECLDSIFMLDYPRQNLEVVIVDNGSSDSTLRIIGDYDVKHCIKSEAGISELRNFGAAISRGEIIGFIDSDCIVVRGWLKKGLSHLKTQDTGIVGCDYSIPEDAVWIEKAWLTGDNDKMKRNVNLPAGNMIMRKDVFEKVGAFDTDLETGEDSDLCIRIREQGYKIISDPDLKNIHSGNPKTLMEVFLKEIWYGKGLLRVLKNQEFTDKVFLFANAFMLLHLTILAMTIFPIPPVLKIRMIILTLMGVFCLLFLSAANKVARSNNYGYLLHLIPIYYFFFLGRSVALLKIYFSALRRHIGTQ